MSSRKAFILDEGFYHTVFDDTSRRNILFSSNKVTKHLVNSFFEDEHLFLNLVVIIETRYPYQDYLDKYDDLVNREKITVDNSIFFIVTLFEPRPATYSYWIPYLNQHYKIPLEKINYFTCAYHELDKDLKAKVFTDPKLGATFTFNYNNLDIYNVHNTINYHTVKTKLFSNLVRRLNPSRLITSAGLITNFDKSDYILSLGTGDENKKGNDDRRQFYNRLAASIGAPINFMDKLPIRFDNEKLDVTNHNGAQYKMIDDELRKCLFEVVYETISTNDLFMEESVKIPDDFFSVTEKSFRHIYNFQIPIFCTPKGFVAKFYETFEFEPFDILPWQEWDSIDNTLVKAKRIIDFLSDIKTSDYKLIFDENKRTLLTNAYRVQNLMKEIHLIELLLAIRGIENYWEPKSLKDFYKLAKAEVDGRS